MKRMKEWQALYEADIKYRDEAIRMQTELVAITETDYGDVVATVNDADLPEDGHAD